MSSIRARAYQVGFGDCLVLSFGYEGEPGGRGERHMLVDFGSTRYPWSGFKLTRIAELIAEHTGGQLDALVATHRHKDHISGFGQAASGELLRSLNPRWVIRPWPDDPDAPADAGEPLRALDEGSRQFAQLLAGTQAFAAALHEQLPKRPSSGLRRTLFELKELHLPNQAAITALEEMAAAAERVDYVAANDRLTQASILPGVKIRILGPPTIKQVPDLDSQARDHTDEFWFHHAAELATKAVGRGAFNQSVFNQLAPPGGLGTARWLLNRLENQTVAGLLRISRVFDKAINNTSVVMLIEAGEWTLLISGDAQIENWSYTLKAIERANQKKLRQQLADADLYKVGHHGSRNGTPKSLHRLWQTERTSERVLHSILSTKSDVHGHTPETAVPRATLTDALAEIGTLESTETIDKEHAVWWTEWTAP